MQRLLFLSIALLVTQPLLSQTQAISDNDKKADTIQSHTAADLQQLEAKLLATAKTSPTGVGLGPIDTLPTSYSLLVVRVHTGEAERHQLWADQMFITRGTVTVVFGGTIIGEHPNGQPGETRGTGIEGGTEQVFHAGDIVHIPANLAHWVKLAPNTTTTYLVFKEK